MAASDLVLIISALTIAATTVIGAVFAGWIALKQIPQVHTLVNKNFYEAKAEIGALQSEVKRLNETALARSEARQDMAAPHGPAAAEQPVATRTERAVDAHD
ncbi:MAG: hypothetical protein ACSLE9_07950 [Burkholderiaceae bacterium]